MFVLRTLIEKYQSLNCKLYACFVDFEKSIFVFNIYGVMFYKLCHANISGLFNNHVIKNMYSENDILIKVGTSLSEQVRQHIGLKQGDNFSPNLFKLFLNDLSKCFDASDDQVELGNINFSCLVYADDLALLSTSETGLQSCLNTIHILRFTLIKSQLKED